MSEFVTMTKAGETIEVHPDAVSNHKKIGWSVLDFLRVEVEHVEKTVHDSIVAAKDAEIAALKAVMGEARKVEAEVEMDKSALIAKAISLEIGTRSVLERWGYDRLRDEIAKVSK